MTKRNILALCGLLAASGLQAYAPGEDIFGLTTQRAFDAARSATKDAVQQNAVNNQTLQNISQSAPGWRTYLGEQGNNVWQGLKGKSGYLWNRGGEALGSAGEKIAQGWDWSKNQPGLGRLTQGLGSLGTTAAGYAANPYLAQSIANRLPSSASFISDYPRSTNVAALAGALGAGYCLYKGGRAAINWYRGPLNYQIENLIEQFNQTQDESKKKSIENQILALSKQNAEIILSQNPTLTLLEKALRAVEGYIAFAKLVPAEKETGNLLSSQFYDFQTKGFGAVAQTLINTIEHSNQFYLPGENNQEQYNYIEKLLDMLSRQEIEFEKLANTSENPDLLRRIKSLRENFLPVIGERLLVLQQTIQENALQSWKTQEIKQNSKPLSLEQQINQIILSKKIAENELYRILKKGQANLNNQEAIAATVLREKIDKLTAQLNQLLEQQQNTGWFGWFRRR